MWVFLEDIDLDRPTSIGNKARMLRVLQRAGLPVPASWVLPIRTRRGSGSPPTTGILIDEARKLARELMACAPQVEQWILRSSSPHEDRPEATGAGLFASVDARAEPEELAEGLILVAGSGERADTRAALELPEGAHAPVAVLAQPHLELELWATLEVRPEEGRVEIEGVRKDGERRKGKRREGERNASDRRDGSGTRGVDASLRWPPSRDPAGRSGASGPLKALLAVAESAVEAAVADAASEVEAVPGGAGWLLELGIQDGQPVLLQIRPAPARGAPALQARIATADWHDFPLFERDEHEDWVWDRAHCPTPLCPLLAGIFVEWLHARGPAWPSRLIQGRWHDRAAPVVDAGSGDAVAGEAAARESHVAAAERIAAALDEWKSVARPRLEESLQRIATLSQNMDRRRWRLFVDAWLEFQTDYFQGPASALRRDAGALLRFLERVHPELPPVPLAPTEARRRDEELDALTDQIRRRFGPMPRGAADARSLARLLLAEPGLDPLRDRVDEHRHRFGHVGSGCWDGRGAHLDEDVEPLLRELALRWGHPPPGAPTARTRSDAFRRAVAAIDDSGQQSRVLVLADLVARALATCENDDSLLAESYAAFRRATRGLAASVGREGDWEDMLDLLPEDLDALLGGAGPTSDGSVVPDSSPARESDPGGAIGPAREADPARGIDPTHWHAAVRNGRALAHMWALRACTPSPEERVRPVGDSHDARVGDSRAGRPASAGTVDGPPLLVDSARAGDGAEVGSILVLPTVVPADAVVFSRLAAVVAESGDRLGHAAVLAREHGLPAVVDVPDARRWLRNALLVRVDGDAGVVTILELREATDS